MLPPFAYVSAPSLSEAVKLAADSGSVILGGGTDLMGCMRERILTPERVVSISRLADLKGVKKVSGGVAIGALTTITQVAEDPVIRERYPGLAAGASEVASPQLRNQGTIGGNLCQKPRCWYYRGEFHCSRKGGDNCFALGGQNQFHAIFGSDGLCAYVHPSDTAPPLVALGAAVEVVGPKGKRQIPVEELHLRPGQDLLRETQLQKGEVLTRILLPDQAAGLISTYRKVRARQSWDFALAGMAIAAALEGETVKQIRVVFSGVATVPWRARGVEKALSGQRLNETNILAAAKAAVAEAQPLEHNAYKVDLLQAVVREELSALTEIQR